MSARGPPLAAAPVSCFSTTNAIKVGELLQPGGTGGLEGCSALRGHPLPCGMNSPPETDAAVISESTDDSLGPLQGSPSPAHLHCWIMGVKGHGQLQPGFRSNRLLHLLMMLRRTKRCKLTALQGLPFEHPAPFVPGVGSSAAAEEKRKEKWRGEVWRGAIGRQ